MSAHGGPGGGGTALFVPPGRVPRVVAFAPAVRGYPGGIADMAGDPDDYVPDLSFDEDGLWIPGPVAAPEDAPTQAGRVPAQAATAQPAPGQPVPDQPVPGQPVPGQSVSVWQQSAAAWQEAGIDWLGPASTGARSVGTAATEDPRTEPIPVLSADGTPRPPRTAAPAQALGRRTRSPSTRSPSIRSRAGAGRARFRGWPGSGGCGGRGRPAGG